MGSLVTVEAGVSMTKEKVLLVEDSKDMQLIVKTALSLICDLHCAENLAQAREYIEKNSFDLMLLDVTLPDGDGFEFCKKLREETQLSDIPIIFLTAEKELKQKVLGFSLGADDYVTKPIEPDEFTARVIAKLRRRKTSKTAVEYGNIKIDLTQQRALSVATNGERDLSLTPIEFKLLAFFVKNAEKTIARDKLFTAVWGGAVHVSGHTVDTHISSLRKKLVESDCALVSIPKQGYCFSTKSKAEGS